jgi:hypothetical protein
MSFFKKIFSKQQKEIIPIYIDLKQIYEMILPTINPQQQDYKVTFLKTHIKFKTASKYDVVEMRTLTRLSSVQLMKKSGRESHWRASYPEYLALYASPAIHFAQTELKKFMLQIESLEMPYTEFTSLVKYEETVRSIKDILMQAIGRELSIRKDILEEAVSLLQQVIYAFETELHEKAGLDKHALLERLKFEEEFMRKQ